MYAGHYQKSLCYSNWVALLRRLLVFNNRLILLEKHRIPLEIFQWSNGTMMQEKKNNFAKVDQIILCFKTSVVDIP